MRPQTWQDLSEPGASQPLPQLLPLPHWTRQGGNSENSSGSSGETCKNAALAQSEIHHNPI